MNLLNPITSQDKPKRIDSNYYVEGYATKYEPYLLYHDIDGSAVYEQFDRAAFNACDMSDVIFLYDHCGKVYARNSNKTLIIEPDNIGLFAAADLCLTTSSKQMYEEISSGLVTRMSWSFLPDRESLEYDPATRTFIHHKIIKIYDVSAVSIPANDATEISARSFADGVIGKAQQELLNRERDKQRLLLKIKLGGINFEN